MTSPSVWHHLNRSAPAGTSSYRPALSVYATDSKTLSSPLGTDQAMSWRNRSIPLDRTAFFSSKPSATSAESNWMNRSAPASQPGCSGSLKSIERRYLYQLIFRFNSIITVQPVSAFSSAFELGQHDDERSSIVTPDVTFNNIVTSTPLPMFNGFNQSQSTTLSAIDHDLSYQHRTVPEPMNLVLPANNENTSHDFELCAIDLRISKQNPTVNEILVHGNISRSTPDADWYPSTDPGSDVESNEVGDAELLNDLSIFEYFEKYQTIDSDSEPDSDGELSLDSKLSNEKHLVQSERIHFDDGMC